MDVAKQVIARIAEFKEVEPETIKPETSIAELGMDSLDALNLIFEFEEEFNLTIPDDDAFEMKTVGEMISGIERLIEAKKDEEEE